MTTMTNNLTRVDTFELFDEFEYQNKHLVVYDKTPTKTLAYERDNPYIEYDIPNEVAVPESDVARFYASQNIFDETFDENDFRFAII